jgi:hypothetical protein
MSPYHKVVVKKAPKTVFMLLEIPSFATSHYATSMQLVVVCNYLDHVCNYKFGIV